MDLDRNVSLVAAMPVQHIEVDANTLKARSRVMLTAEEAQLLDKSATARNKDIQLVSAVEVQSLDVAESKLVIDEPTEDRQAKDKSVVPKNSRTPARKDSVADFQTTEANTSSNLTQDNNAVSKVSGTPRKMKLFVDKEEEPSEKRPQTVCVKLSGSSTSIPVFSLQPRMKSLLDNRVKKSRPGAQTGTLPGRGNSSGVQSLLQKVSKERGAQEVLVAVRSIQTTDSSDATKSAATRTTPRKKETGQFRGIKSVLRTKAPPPVVKPQATLGPLTCTPLAASSGAGNTGTGAVPLSMPSATQEVKLGTGILEGKLNLTGIKGIKPGQVLYLVPNSQIVSRPQGKVKRDVIAPVADSISFREVDNVSRQQPDVVTTSVAAATCPAANSAAVQEGDVEATQLFIIPNIEEQQISPTKYLVQARRSIPVMSAPGVNSVSDQGSKDADGIPTDLHLATVPVSSAPQCETTAVQTSAADSEVTDKSNVTFANLGAETSKLVDTAELLSEIVPNAMEGTTYTLEPEKARSEVDPYDVDSIIKGFQSDDVIDAGTTPIHDADDNGDDGIDSRRTEENSLNEDLEFLSDNMSASPTTSIMRVQVRIISF